MSARIVPLPTGADLRLRNEHQTLAVLLVNGGTAKPLGGTWSATSELLAGELAPRFGQLTFAELRYRVKSWNQLPSCMADAEAALDLLRDAGSARTLLVGFSMGGAVSIGVAAHPSVGGVLGLAPWVPERLSVEGLRGKRFDVVHGSWDRYLPFVPGVSPTNSKKGFERARALGVEGGYVLIHRGVHGAAVRRGSGALVRLPRWQAWVEHVADRVERFAGHQL
ncbi:MAG: hypothetical protein ACR2HI_01000 [Gaiella sp.]